MGSTTASRRYTIIFILLDSLFFLSGLFVLIVTIIWKRLVDGPIHLDGTLFLHLAVSDGILSGQRTSLLWPRHEM